jgi:hypothetical protein
VLALSGTEKNEEFSKFAGQGGFENPREKVCPAFFSHLVHAAAAQSDPRKSRGSSFLIATRRKLEIELTPSQQTRNDFLIATFSDVSVPAPLPAGAHREFLIAADQIEKICNRMKTEEKRFSNRNKKAMFAEIGATTALRRPLAVLLSAHRWC